jgi:CheY-like chemotaxis protein
VALSELASADCDGVQIDLDLPGVDGLALARMIRAQANRARLPLIGISARARGDEEALCLRAGMNGFLRKPVFGGSRGTLLARAMPCVGGA